MNDHRPGLETPRDHSLRGLLRRLFPPWLLLTVIVVLAVQCSVFWGTRLLLVGREMHSIALPLDHRIPLRPGWVVVYFLSFPFWAVNALWILHQERAHAYRAASTYVLSLLVCAAFFLIWPCTLQRPEIRGEGFFEAWMRFLYRVDSPTNIFPSLHVLMSYYCWRFTLGCKRIPNWYKIFSLVFTVLVCFCILYVKQHLFLDIPSALLVGEGVFQLTRLLRPERALLALERRLKKEKEE